jgi:uncharacterized protein (DUF2147 family)
MNNAVKHNLVWIALCAATLFVGAYPLHSVQAQTPPTPSSAVSPLGLWQSIDDATGKPRAQIRISESAGVLTGRIAASSTPTPPGVVQLCTQCPGERNNQPLIGLPIIQNMRQQGGENLWAGGEILDPDKGSTYRLELSTQDAGKKLRVRGYIGPFFRNQTWVRLE